LDGNGCVGEYHSPGHLAALNGPLLNRPTHRPRPLTRSKDVEESLLGRLARQLLNLRAPFTTMSARNRARRGYPYPKWPWWDELVMPLSAGRFFQIDRPQGSRPNSPVYPGAMRAIVISPSAIRPADTPGPSCSSTEICPPDAGVCRCRTRNLSSHVSIPNSPGLGDGVEKSTNAFRFATSNPRDVSFHVAENSSARPPVYVCAAGRRFTTSRATIGGGMKPNLAVDEIDGLGRLRA